MEDGEKEGTGKRKLTEDEEEDAAPPEAKKAKVQEEEEKGEEEAMDTTEGEKAETEKKEKTKEEEDDDEEEQQQDEEKKKEEKKDEKEATKEEEEEESKETAEKPLVAEAPAEPPMPPEPGTVAPVVEKNAESEAPPVTSNATVAAPVAEKEQVKVEAVVPEPAPARPTPPPPAEDKAAAVESQEKAEVTVNGTEVKPAAPTATVAVPTGPPVTAPPVAPTAASPPQAAPKENGDLGSREKDITLEEGSRGFKVAWLDLAHQAGNSDTEALLAQVRSLDADVLGLQGVGASSQWGPSLQSSLESLGYQCLRGTGDSPLALLVRRGSFLVQDHSCVSLQALVNKDLEASSLDEGDRSAVQTHLGSSGDGQLLTARLSPNRSGGVGGSPSQSLLVANACLAPAPPSANALQVCCLARELCREQCQGRVLLGQLQLVAGSPAYQLLRDGYLDDDMIEELQRHCDVPRPGKENAALVNLLWKAFQHPSSSLRSCYAAAKGNELPGGASSPAWFSSESLRVLEAQNAEQTCTVRLAFCPQ